MTSVGRREPLKGEEVTSNEVQVDDSEKDVSVPRSQRLGSRGSRRIVQCWAGKETRQRNACRRSIRIYIHDHIRYYGSSHGRILENSWSMIFHISRCKKNYIVINLNIQLMSTLHSAFYVSAWSLETDGVVLVLSF